MSSYELIVKPVENMPALVSNIEEIKEALEISLVKYQQLVVTEDAIDDAKVDRANLNKLKKSISDERIAQKKNFLAPFEVFETKCKEVEKLIADTSSNIDVQIKTFEEMEKEEKKSVIENIYIENIGEYSKLIPLSKIWNDRWLNKTFRFEEIEATIREIKANADTHLNIINELDSEFKEQLKDVYFNTLDITSALNENARLIKQKEMMAELEAKKEAERVEKAESMPEIKKSISEALDDLLEEKIITQVFKVECTRNQLVKLGEYMRANGIKYGNA